MRGLNGTVTRSPATNVVLSFAWAIASSYWTVGRSAGRLGGRGAGRWLGRGRERRGQARDEEHGARRRGRAAGTGGRGADAAGVVVGAGGRDVVIDAAVLERVSGDVPDCARTAARPIARWSRSGMVRGGLVRSGAVATARGQWIGNDTVVDCEPSFVSRPLTLNLTVPGLPLDLSRKVDLVRAPRDLRQPDAPASEARLVDVQPRDRLSSSADVIVIVIFWPRPGVVSLSLKRNASMSNAIVCVATSVPSVAVTTEV